MSAFDEKFHVLEDSRWKRFRRDVRLIRWLLLFVLFYLIAGGKVRRKYARLKARGEPFWLDPGNETR